MNKEVKEVKQRRAKEVNYDEHINLRINSAKKLQLIEICDKLGINYQKTIRSLIDQFIEDYYIDLKKGKKD